MKERALLQDVLLLDEYIKIVTSEGSFICSKGTNDIDELAVKALKSVGKQIDIKFASSEEAFKSIFEDLSEVPETQVPVLPIQREFTAHSSTKIFGPPGTGKTTKLIGYVKEAVNSGVLPNDIAFISFSNGAATVAKRRVVEALPGYGSIDFPNFSTMHSLATRVGNDAGMKLMVEEHFLSFDPTIECWKEWTELDNPLGAVERYRHPVLDEYGLAIAEQRPVNYFFDDFSENDKKKLHARLIKKLPEYSELDLNELCKAYVQSFLTFKEQRRLLTFNDVIEAVVSNESSSELLPTFELLIIDEAQDLSNHLWSFATKLIKRAKTTYIAGDDDQAIMIGIGANPFAFVGYATTNDDQPLINSYRIPKSLRGYVDAGVMPELEKLPNRAGVTWQPTSKTGYLNSGSASVVLDDSGEKRVVNYTFTPNNLLSRVRDEYLLSQRSIADFSDDIYMQEAYADIRRCLYANKLYEINLDAILNTAVMKMGFDDPISLLIEVGKGEVTADEIISYSFPNISASQHNKNRFPKLKTNPPDWLIMAPTKRTGEKLSNALIELNIPHFYRNKPIFGATKNKTMIRVQTVHMSKGDEAHNAAVVVDTFGDVLMLAKDPRLSYVALTRASNVCYPRVCREGLLSAMIEANQKRVPWGFYAIQYKKMFPITTLHKT